MLKKLRARVGWFLRHTLADNLDPDHAPRAVGLAFRFQRGIGIVVHEDAHGDTNRGCSLWYIGGEEEYSLAHEPSTAPVVLAPAKYWRESI